MVAVKNLAVIAVTSLVFFSPLCLSASQKREITYEQRCDEARERILNKRSYVQTEIDAVIGFLAIANFLPTGIGIREIFFRRNPLHGALYITGGALMTTPMIRRIYQLEKAVDHEVESIIS